MPDETDSYDTAATMMPFPAGTIMSVTKQFLKAVGYWPGDGASNEAQDKAIAVLRQQIVFLDGQVQQLYALVNDLNRRVARDENIRRLDKLAAALDAARKTMNRLTQRPGTPQEWQALAYDAAVDADRFVTDVDRWLWSDVAVSHPVDEITGQPHEVTRLVDAQFTTYPALPVYVVLTAALALGVAGYAQGDPARAEEFGDQLRGQLAWLSVRDGWQDHSSQVPATLPEYVRERIVCYPVAQTKYAVDRECVFSLQCDNGMDRSRTSLRVVSTTMPPGEAVLCTVDPDLGIDDEREVEANWGVETATTIHTVLAHLLGTGALPREPWQGRFDTTPRYNNAFVYAVDLNGGLQWWHQQASTSSSTLTGWEGPKQVGSGWDVFDAVIPAGGDHFYGLKPDGTLHWYQHDGFNDGTPVWPPSVQVGVGWGSFLKVVGGSDGVLYAVRPDGRLLWYRHDDFRTGGLSWRGPTELTDGWADYRHIFGGGDGILYAVAADGTLEWRRHRGFTDGSNAWDGPVGVGTGWDQFEEVFSVGEGAIFGIRPDGTMWWYRHNAWNTDGLIAPARPAEPDGNDRIHLEPHFPSILVGGGIEPAPPGGRFRSTIEQHHPLEELLSRQWDGPLPAGTDWHLARTVIPLLPSSPDPLH